MREMWTVYVCEALAEGKEMLAVREALLGEYYLEKTYGRGREGDERRGRESQRITTPIRQDSNG
jgi:hypothetical protein